MKNTVYWLIALLSTGSVMAGQVVSLENELLRLEWDTARGTLVSLKDKATGHEWLDPKLVAPIYAVQFTNASVLVLSTNATAVTVRQDESAVIIEGTHEKPFSFKVKCEFRLEKGSPQVIGRISVLSQSPCQIAEVKFPMVTLRLPFTGNGEEDRILWPECDGTLLNNPSVNRPDRQFKYPGGASMQMMAAFDPSAGLYLAARDTEAHTKKFCTRRLDKNLELSIAHVLPQTPVNKWELGYDVALAGLRPSKGLKKIKWEAAADLYREWAIRQQWCRQTMAQRVATGDIPKWITEPTLIFTYSLRGQMQDKKPGNRQPLVLDQVERWGKVVDAPITCLIMSWEKLDTWVTPDYFPPYGGESEFTAMTKELHARGNHTMVFLSGLHWTLHKDLAGPDRPRVLVNQEADFNRRGRAFAISDAKGEAEINGTPDKGVGQTATICSSTALAREILVDTSLQCQKLGIDCVQVDQIVGGGMRECYHPKHNHPPGGGTWCSRALYRIFEEIRKTGKNRDPNFAFSIEEPGEFYLPLLDTYHARDLHQGRWPRSGAGVLGVPLFTHVYHDYLAGYGSEGCYVSDKSNRLALYQIGMNLVCGKMPAVAIWGRWCEPEKVEATQRRLLRAHIDLWRGPAGEFLNFGQRIASPELDVPPLEMTFMEKDGKTRRPLVVPSVLHGTWKLADGRTGVIFACINNKPVEFTFDKERFALETGEAMFRSTR
ncbi:MAG: DUF6259 domain-containing protein [Kiritimatiellae bacterium]|nr:DUF6259 domain-containing protein [Kiritimatiellia bacterium]MDD5519331.1 DUF6259 domain-containing protein [Kiritimatiellia bacterium]